MTAVTIEITTGAAHYRAAATVSRTHRSATPDYALATTVPMALRK
jgi:hypothetical protein